MAEGHELPTGRGSLRASDADRELVVERVERHWHEGRLTQEEMEDRVGRALSARTLGDLRGVLRDLPEPPPPLLERLRRSLPRLLSPLPGLLARTVVSVVAIAVLGVVVLAVLGAVIDDPPQRSPSAPPRFRPPSSSPAPYVGEVRETRVKVGEWGVDDGMAFRVLGVRARRTVEHRELYGEQLLLPDRGHRFLEVPVDVVNRTRRSTDPFCGETGARLFTREGDAYDPVVGLHRLAGNDRLCSGGIAPDERARLRLVFQVPRRARTARVNVWNGDSEAGDISGRRTQLRVRV